MPLELVPGTDSRVVLKEEEIGFDVLIVVVTIEVAMQGYGPGSSLSTWLAVPALD